MKYRRYCTVDAQIFQAAQLGHGTIYFNINNILRFLRWTGLRIRIRWDSCVFPYTWKNPVFRSCFRPEGESFKIKRWRDVNVTSTLVNVCKTLTNVDASRRPPYLSKSARRWRLKAYLSKAETLTWRQRFGKHTLGILLVDVWVECKHKQRSDLIN